MKTLMLFFCILLLVSCSSDDSNDDKDCPYFHPNVRSYCFDIGSWWVYKSADSELFDTICVIKSTYTSVTTGGGMGYAPTYLKVVQMDMHNSFTDSTYTDYAFLYYLSKGEHNGGFFYIDPSKSTTGEVNVSSISEETTMTVLGNCYSDIVRIQANKDKYLGKTMVLYFSPGIGVIQKEILENDEVVETWDLLNYQVSLFNIPECEK